MPNYQAVTRERHATQRWHPSSGYAFAARDAIVPLVAAELPKAAMALPIAFNEQAGHHLPAAVLSLLPEKNLFVAQNGTWAGSYIPSAFRSYPFRFLKSEEGQQVLCVDEDSGLVTIGIDGERFFGEDGQPAQGVLNILNFLSQIEQNRVQTAAACALLQKHHLIVPWSITLKTEAGDQNVAGLFQIDEAALSRLSAEALLEASQSGALQVAYCQLLSMQHLPNLVKLLEAQAKVAAQSAQQVLPQGKISVDFFNKDGTISFGGLL